MNKMINFLKERGWVIKNNSAYLKKDSGYKIPYSIEGTYKLYIEGIYDESMRGDN